MGFASLLADADRAVFAAVGDASVLYTPGSGAAVTVSGVFDAVYVRVEAGEAGASSSGPAVFLRLEDLPSDPETDLGARVTVGGVVYEPREVAKDGTGGVLLHLHTVA